MIMREPTWICLNKGSRVLYFVGESESKKVLLWLVFVCNMQSPTRISTLLYPSSVLLLLERTHKEYAHIIILAGKRI